MIIVHWDKSIVGAEIRAADRLVNRFTDVDSMIIFCCDLETTIQFLLL